MNTSDLIKRLRAPLFKWPMPALDVLVNEAADTIERLQAELNQAIAERDGYKAGEQAWKRRHDGRCEQLVKREAEVEEYHNLTVATNASRFKEQAERQKLQAELNQAIAERDAHKSRVELLEHDMKSGDYESLYAHAATELNQSREREAKLRGAITVVLNNSQSECIVCPICDHEEPVAGSDYTRILRAALQSAASGMETRTCGTCAFRGTPILIPGDEDSGWADRESSYFCCDRVKFNDNARNEIKGEQSAFVMDGSGYFAALCVEEDFGCNQWSIKEGL